MSRTFGLAAMLACAALVFGAGALPAYADPGDDNGNHFGQEKDKGNNNGNGGGGPAADHSGRSSGPAANAPAGNNGTIKVHDGPASTHPWTESDEERNNEPHVGCVFHLYGFHFDADQSGTWEIVAWSPTRDLAGISGSWQASSVGDYQSGDLSLQAGGHYRLNFYTFDGHAKHKTFWAAGCNTTATATPPPATTGGTTTNTTSSGSSTNSGSESTVERTEVTPTTTTPTGVLGFESAPLTGGAMPVETTTNVAALGVESPALASLPSTSTVVGDPALGALGISLLGTGAWMLRRRPRR